MTVNDYFEIDMLLGVDAFFYFYFFDDLYYIDSVLYHIYFSSLPYNPNLYLF